MNGAEQDQANQQRDRFPEIMVNFFPNLIKFVKNYKPQIQETQSTTVK